MIMKRFLFITTLLLIVATQNLFDKKRGYYPIVERK